MKKAILTFGLFSLVVLTSFTTTENQTQNVVAETGDTGGGSTGNGQVIIGNKKLDTDTSGNRPQIKLNVSDAGDTKGQVLNGNKKLD
ncbi:hypothetical protein [Flavobacterium sp. 28YEA47A]|uniref:hypothetical protein n=1 Tax=Flavobacterium sp. 28YEA47A TaxID=3156276 RepID=UPI0035136891